MVWQGCPAVDLPANYRTVLILRDIEQHSTGEAAALLNMTPMAVKVRLHRARQALTTLLKTSMPVFTQRNW
jgi:RNA polymerase sigma-70 factor (ECF subfamily)